MILYARRSQEDRFGPLDYVNHCDAGSSWNVWTQCSATREDRRDWTKYLKDISILTLETFFVIFEIFRKSYPVGLLVQKTWVFHWKPFAAIFVNNCLAILLFFNFIFVLLNTGISKYTALAICVAPKLSIFALHPLHMVHEIKKSGLSPCDCGFEIAMWRVCQFFYPAKTKGHNTPSRPHGFHTANSENVTPLDKTKKPSRNTLFRVLRKRVLYHNTFALPSVLTSHKCWRTLES